MHFSISVHFSMSYSNIEVWFYIIIFKFQPIGTAKIRLNLNRASMLKEDASPSKSTKNIEEDRNRTDGVHLRKSTACNRTGLTMLLFRSITYCITKHNQNGNGYSWQFDSINIAFLYFHCFATDETAVVFLAGYCQSTRCQYHHKIQWSWMTWSAWMWNTGAPGAIEHRWLWMVKL